MLLTSHIQACIYSGDIGCVYCSHAALNTYYCETHIEIDETVMADGRWHQPWLEGLWSYYRPLLNIAKIADFSTNPTRVSVFREYYALKMLYIEAYTAGTLFADA